MICPNCFGGNVFCEACGGSGVVYCCDSENVDQAPGIIDASFSRDSQDFDWEALRRLRKSSSY